MTFQLAGFLFLSANQGLTEGLSVYYAFRRCLLPILYLRSRWWCSHIPIYPMMSSFRSSCGTLKLWSRESRTWRSFHKQNKNCSCRWRCKERINIYNAIFWLLYLIMGHITLFLGASFFRMENNEIFWHRGSIKWFFNFSSYIAYTNTCK